MRTKEELIRRLEGSIDRLIVGITGKDSETCDWYEGILYDAISELREDLADLEAAGGDK